MTASTSLHEHQRQHTPSELFSYVDITVILVVTTLAMTLALVRCRQACSCRSAALDSAAACNSPQRFVPSSPRIATSSLEPRNSPAERAAPPDLSGRPDPVSH
ncbi:hypothetical protein BaRGS_00030250 [Batillaria attramentaria]|uniref:Uncharacterized protein n=1 Tax=Batillaria attramentaria TaxID=370345 RepID=A0ABD0JTQ6_9CAEN